MHLIQLCHSERSRGIWADNSSYPLQSFCFAKKSLDCARDDKTKRIFTAIWAALLNYDSALLYSEKLSIINCPTGTIHPNLSAIFWVLIASIVAFTSFPTGQSTGNLSFLSL